MNQILILSTQSVQLAFGLEWLPLVTGRPERSAHQIAQRHRATHLVLASEAASSVGLAHLEAQRQTRNQTVHSAAQAVARLFSSGTVALILELGNDNYWTVAVHEGAVITRTDTIYASDSEARAVLDDIKRAHPALRMLNDDLMETPSLAAIAAAVSNRTRLCRVRRLFRLKYWVLAALCVPAAAGLAFAWSSTQKRLPEPPSMPDGADLKRQWMQATEAAASRVTLQGVQGTRRLLDSLLDLPISLSGWGLQQVDCRTQTQGWDCIAHYARQNNDATNAGLLESAPAQWQVDFPSIERAQASWHLHAPGTSLRLKAVQSHGHNRRHLQSELQRIRLAFARLDLGEATPFPVSLPAKSKQAPSRRPPNVPIYLVRRIDVSGPLRSALLLLPHVESIQWQKVTLSLRPLSQPSLQASRFAISFAGELYETQGD